MKFSILLLPALLEAALVVALHSDPPAALAVSAMQREAEVRSLRAEQRSVHERLTVFEAQGRVFLPRGMNARSQ